MEELRHILYAQAERYPQMQPADAVKLIYQNEFGGGHLIKDEAACLEYLRREYVCVEKNPVAERCEYIGNGISRIHLAALADADLEPLGQAFLRSAATHSGSMANFLAKLDLLAELVRQDIFSFDSDALEAYLSEYKKKGCPMVSHSDAYRATYRPAYRVIKASK